ncbi:tryptophan 7-halogenase [Catenovulum sp. SM1970]|uniref:tryptophan halogenase family protein n=1 Tax=Marinifaba aquimaris TaxID=2741323 RepID=UPI001574176D|nr:tryptophan halogenase family protein [Marinifaba aquimaris]NTS76611.1 tryptophan 7-halogenase [Marinifaba aquimaris]
MTIKNVAIIGGGTAGWITANHLGKALEKEQIQITLIEDPDTPIIGVGEGTVPMMRQTLQHFGISESEFISQCDATFKQSIKFVNWLDKHQHGENNYYHHLFDYPFPFNEDLTPYWLNKTEQSFADTVSFQGLVCDNFKAPKRITDKEYEGATTYAYHLNAAKFAKLLKKHAEEQFGVKYLSAKITDVTFSEDGSIRELLTDKAESLPFDFYVDSSGFQGFLIEKKLNVGLIDKSKELLTNTAIAVQVPTEKDRIIPPYTISTAHQAGWIWDIALPERRGVGFVFSNNHLNTDLAYQKVERYIGRSLDELSPREIKMRIGFREKFWAHNCVAIGLSQGFVEPLEATALLLTDFSAKLLAERFPRDKQTLAPLARRYNEQLTEVWTNTLDFIKLHYCISDRTDSDFWIDNRAPETISQRLADRLAIWQQTNPVRSDFPSKIEVFDIENYLYVLYGMKFKTAPPELDLNYSNRAEQQSAQVNQMAKKLAEELPQHRELLVKIAKYGLNQI